MSGLTRVFATPLCASLVLLTLCTASSCPGLAQSSVTSTPQITSPNATPPPTAHASLSPEAFGDVMLARRRYVEAIASYQEEPKQSSTLWNKLGIAYQHILNDHEARHYYEKALAANPNNAEAINNLATVMYGQKNYGAAVRLYRRALKLNPKSSAVHGNLGTAYFAQGKFKKGTEAYREALTIDPTAFEHDSAITVQQGTPARQRAEVSYFLAKAYAQSGDKDRALRYLRRAFAQGFNDRKKLMSDKELVVLRETPEFRQMLSEEHLN